MIVPLPAGHTSDKPMLVLNAGCGPRHPGRLHSLFRVPEWRELTLDLDPKTQPDFVGSITDMREFFPAESFEAVWCSHSLEHLYVHEVPAALSEFRRILKSNGFAIVTCPDVQAVAGAVATKGLDEVAYVAPAGPITLHDIIYGHGPSVRNGDHFMAHKTGFTSDRLGILALEAGFLEAYVGCGSAFDLWAVLTMPDTNLPFVTTLLAGSEAEFLFRSRIAKC